MNERGDRKRAFREGIAFFFFLHNQRSWSRLYWRRALLQTKGCMVLELRSFICHSFSL